MLIEGIQGYLVMEKVDTSNKQLIFIFLTITIFAVLHTLYNNWQSLH
jgi:hypothetical protein